MENPIAEPAGDLQGQGAGQMVQLAGVAPRPLNRYQGDNMSATDYTLPPLPPEYDGTGCYSGGCMIDYGIDCAEAARAPLLARIAEFDTARSAWLAAQAINQRTIERLQAEVESMRKAAVEVATFAKPNYSTARHASVRKGHSLSGELLHYTVRPGLLNKLKKAAQRGEGKP